MRYITHYYIVNRRLRCSDVFAVRYNYSSEIYLIYLSRHMPFTVFRLTHFAQSSKMADSD